jgi:PAS domain S-box-containing protein
MSFYFTPWIILPLLSAAVNGSLAVYAWRRRNSPAAGWLSGIMICLTGWSLFYSLNTCSADLWAKILFYQLGSLFSLSLLYPVLPMVLLLLYPPKPPDRVFSVILAGVPVLLILLVFTNPLTGLMRRDFHLVRFGELVLLGYQNGPGETFLKLYTFAYYIVVSLICLWYGGKRRQPRRTSLILIVAATLTPLLAEAISAASFPGFRLTTSVLLVSGICYWLAVFRHFLLDLVPIAHTALFEQMQEPVLVIDPEGRLAKTNRAGIAILGIPEEAVGRPLDELFPSASPFRLLSGTADAATIQDSAAGRWWHVSKTAIRLRDSELGSLLILRDVTELHQVQEELRRNEERFRQLAEESADALWQLDRDLRCTYINKADYWMRGFDASEVLGHSIFEMVIPGDEPKIQTAVSQCEAWEAGGGRQGPLRLEVQLKKKSGGWLWTEFQINPLRRGTGELSGYIGIARDITDRKAAEDCMAKSLTTEHEVRNEQGRFLDMISHECRNPLAIIQANLDLLSLKAEEGQDGLASPISKMNRAVDRLVGLLASVRRRQGFDQWLQDVEPEKIQIEEFLKDLMIEAREFWGDHFIVSAEMQSGCSMMADKNLLRTALLNLLENSVKFSPAENNVDVKAEKTGPCLSVILRNRSALPLSADTSVLFNRYSRGTNSAGTTGTGIGLYLAKSIIEKLGGNIKMTVSGEVEVAVHVTLPLKRGLTGDMYVR